MNRSCSKPNWLAFFRQDSVNRALRICLAVLLVFPLNPALLFAQGQVPTAVLPASTAIPNLDYQVLQAIDVEPQTGTLIAPVVDLKFGAGQLQFELLRQARALEDGKTGFGKGWASTLTQRLEGLNTDSACFVDATGHRRWFEKSGEGNYTATRGYGATLAKSEAGWQITGFGDGKIYSFNEAGLLTKTALKSGASIDYTYADGKLTGVSTPYGKLSVTHTVAGLIDTVKFGNKTWKYVYNVQGQLSRVVQPSKVFWDYSYDVEGRLSGIGHNAVKISYDAVSRVTEIKGQNVRARKFSYLSSVDPFRSYMTLIEDATGRLSLVSQSYDGQLIETITSEGETTLLELDERDRPIVVTKSDGQKWEYGYDELGRHSVTEEPNGLVTTYTYTGERLQPTSIKRGNETYKFAYDAQDRLTKIVAPTGATETFSFDELGRVKTTTDIRKLARTYSYDARGYLASVSNSLKQTEQFKFDEVGRLVQYTRPDGVSTSIAYNERGQITKVKEAEQRELSFEYNQLGQVTARVDQYGRRIETIYNRFGEVAAVSDGVGLIQAYEYDEAGRLASVTDANGNSTKYQYDEQKLSITNAQGIVRKYLKNKLGNVVEETLPNGKKVAFSYNKQGLLSKVVAPDSQVSMFKYDKLGRMTFMGNKSGQFGLSYDAFGRISELTDGQLKKSVKYEYNDASDRIAMDLPFGRIEYKRDELGRIAAIKDVDGQLIKFKYNANSQRTAILYPNGVSTRFVYDKQLRLESVTTKNAAGKVLSLRKYAYDKFDRRVSMTNEKNEVEKYGYDNRGRLVKVEHGANTQQFTYDDANNRTSKTINGKTQRYTVGKNNELLSTGTERFTYDKFGRVATKISRTGIVRYQYDHNDRLVKLIRANGSVIKYGYAPNGTRVWRERDGKRRYYLYDFADVVAEYDAKGKMTRSYTHGPENDDVLASHANGKSSYYHFDAMRSVVAMTGANGNVEARYDYDVFGKVRKAEGKAARWNPYSFTSRRRDPAAGLIFFRARFYMTSTGRFTSLDPAGFFDGPNRYSYAQNNPVEFNDPFGLWSLKGIWNKTVDIGSSVVNGAVNTVKVVGKAAVHIGKNPVAFAKGFGKGLYNGAKGIVNMVVHPVETFNGIKHAIVNYKETGAAIGELVRKYKKAFAEDPEAFADMTGQILGELTLAVAGTKGLDKVAKLKTLSNIANATSKASKATGLTRAAGSVGTKVANVARNTGTRLASAGRSVANTARKVGARAARRYPAAATAARVIATNAGKVAKRVKDVAAKRVSRARAMNRAIQMRKARVAALGGNFLVRSGRAIAAFPGKLAKTGRNFIRDPGAFLGYGAFALGRTTLKIAADTAKLGRHAVVYGTFTTNVAFRDQINESIDRYKNRSEGSKAVGQSTTSLLRDAEKLSAEEFEERLNQTGGVYDDYRNSLIKPVRDATNQYNQTIKELTDNADDEDPLVTLSRFEQASRDWANSHEDLLRKVYDGVEGVEEESSFDNPSASRSKAFENEADFLDRLNALDLDEEKKKLVEARMQDLQYRRGVEYGLYHGGYHEQLIDFLATGELNIEGLEDQLPGLAAEDPMLSGGVPGDGGAARSPEGSTKGMADALDEIFDDE